MGDVHRVEAAAQDLERHYADATAEERRAAHSGVDLEPFTERGCYLYGRCEIQERRTAAPDLEEQAGHFPVVIVERERPRQEGVEGNGIACGPGHGELSWLYRCVVPAVAEQGVAAEFSALLDSHLVELHALAA